MPRNKIVYFTYQFPMNSELPFENFNISETFTFYKILEYLDYEELILNDLENIKKDYCHTIGKESASDWISCKILSLFAESAVQHTILAYLLLFILMTKNFIRKYRELKST